MTNSAHHVMTQLCSSELNRTIVTMVVVLALVFMIVVVVAVVL